MRNMLMAGTAGLFLALGAAGAAHAANPNVPSYSPYAIMGDDSARSAPLLPFVPFLSGGPGYDRGPDAGMTEGRAAYVDPDQGFGSDSPQYMAPEDRNLYSRGR
jgi:hypothetical protein